MIPSNLPKPQDKLAILKRMSLFASCDDEQLELVAQRSRLVEYKKNETIYKKGDVADAFYVVASGRLQVYSTINNQKRIYTVLHNGDTFGEISLLTGETHSATVEALNDALVLELEKTDFDELINKIPSLVLHLSRLLSKRLRIKEQTEGEYEATVVSIYSAAQGVGRTLFAISLAMSLKRETHRDVVIVDFNTPEGELNRFFGASRHTSVHSFSVRSYWSEESLEQEVLSHPLGFNFLFAGDLTDGEEGQHFVAPIISGLTKRYSYILLDLPVEVGSTVLKALTQSDLVYFISDSAKENIIRTNALIRQAIEAVNYKDEQIKIILNLMECTKESLDAPKASQMLGRGINFTLPRIDSYGSITAEEIARILESQESAYSATIRRIARELGKVLVGLALGSGAALGLAHIGVLKVIEKERIPVDIISGTSIGALIGGLWASGMSATELEELTRKFKNPWAVRTLFILDLGIPLVSILIGLVAGIIIGALAGVWTGILFGLIAGTSFGLIFGPLVGGPIQGTRITEFLEKVFEDKTFEDTRIPIKIVASNPMEREQIVFETGKLSTAVRASVSIPGIFKPVQMLGNFCVDGGVSNPVPVNLLKQSGAKYTIAVNVFATTEELIEYQKNMEQEKALKEAQLASKRLPVRLFYFFRREISRTLSPFVFDVIMRSMQYMEYQIAEASSQEADITLHPSVPGSSWLEFYNPEKFIQKGEEEAIKNLAQLKQLTGLSTHSLTSTS